MDLRVRDGRVEAGSCPGPQGGPCSEDLRAGGPEQPWRGGCHTPGGGLSPPPPPLPPSPARAGGRQGIYIQSPRGPSRCNLPEMDSAAFLAGLPVTFSQECLFFNLQPGEADAMR